MAVHVLDAADSDGESWMEVLEGSPGPSMRNSRAASFCAADRQAHSTECEANEDEDDDESWVCDFEDSHDSKADCDTGLDAPPCTTKDEPDCTPDDKRSDHNQPPYLEYPEVGDIKYHYREVEDLSKENPDKAVYYRSWLCWLYRMKLPKIQDIVRHAPDYIIQVVNHLCGLHNHVFWRAGDSKYYHYQWWLMYDACETAFIWWDTKWRLQTPNSGQDNGVELSSGPDSNSSPPPCPPPYDQAITPNLDGKYHCPTLGDALLFLDTTYKSLNGRSPDEVGQCAISFQTWIQWVQSTSASASFPPSWIDNAPEYAFIKSIGLPREAFYRHNLFGDLPMYHKSLTASLLPGGDSVGACNG